MKINCKVLTMALGGAVLPWGLAFAEDQRPFPKPLTSVGSLTDVPALGESTTVAPQRPVMTLDQRPAAFRENAVEVAGKPTDKKGQVFHSAGYSTSISENTGLAMPTPDAAPMMSEPMMSSTHSMMPTAGCSTGNCGSGSCGGGSCSTGMCGESSCSTCSVGLSCGGCRKLGWFETEALLWWAPVTRTPELVVTGPRFNQPNTLEIGGEQTLDGQMIPGMRTNFGFWVDDCQSIGIGGRAFGLFSDPQTTTVTSDGSRTLGVPYFDTSSGQPNVALMSFDTNGNGFNTGSVTVATDTDFASAEAYGKLLLTRSACSRADVIGGYTFARLDTSVGLSTTTVDGIINTVQDGTTTRTSDVWSARNEFHGGHVGILTDVSKGRLSISTLGKVAIGTMQQSGNVSGTTTVTNPSGTVTGSGNTGLFSLQSNRGNYTRDVMTFIPEAGAKLGYRMKQNLTFRVGYTFLFLPDVALGSGMIDTNVDVFGAGLGTPNRPDRKFDHGSYYLHGLDLGLTFTF